MDEFLAIEQYYSNFKTEDNNNNKNKKARFIPVLFLSKTGRIVYQKNNKLYYFINSRTPIEVTDLDLSKWF